MRYDEQLEDNAVNQVCVLLSLAPQELTLGQLDSTVSWFLSLTSKIALGAQNTGWPALIVNP